jgi:hypothetical protein
LGLGCPLTSEERPVDGVDLSGMRWGGGHDAPGHRAVWSRAWGRARVGGPRLGR